jgi:hypothetical protein
MVLLEGPAGIGKSAVLEQFLSDEEGLIVLRATGEQWEASFAYGVVDQLMRTAGVKDSRVLAGRHRSLPTEEPVGVGALCPASTGGSGAEGARRDRRDDAHWADIDSLRTLLFLARRLVGNGC